MKNIVGATAGMLCVVSVTPQVYQVIKTNSTRDISLGSVLLMILMSVLWVWYGILIMDWPIILTDVGVILQEFVILAYKIKHIYFVNNNQEE
jgi:MtN3 and saliva related transmembrane protein